MPKYWEFTGAMEQGMWTLKVASLDQSFSVWFKNDQFLVEQTGRVFVHMEAWAELAALTTEWAKEHGSSDA